MVLDRILQMRYYTYFCSLRDCKGAGVQSLQTSNLNLLQFWSSWAARMHFMYLNWKAQLRTNCCFLEKSVVTLFKVYIWISRYPHFHSTYLLGVPYQYSETVFIVQRYFALDNTHRFSEGHGTPYLLRLKSSKVNNK